MDHLVLTPRQQTVLELAANGNTEQRSAELLGISVFTLKEHRKHVLRRLDARSMSHAVAIGFQKGILE